MRLSHEFKRGVRRNRRWSLLAAAILFVPLLARAESGPVASTTFGPVSGFEQNGVYEFLGIPYAAPPVGDLRWRPPQPPAAWTAPRDATKFGNTCPQGPHVGGFAAPSTTEDCLYLNVYISKDLARGRSRKQPVMVWIYGGGLSSGESNDYDGSKLVLDGHTVVVTFNYRLGVLGFFAHPALDSENHDLGNYGIMDQQFALQWVQQNIAAFGGDPHNVTIFGESAGGGSVIGHLASPKSTGLFQQAISESGGYIISTFENVPLATAETTGQNFASAVGCATQTSSCVRGLSVEQILANQSAYLTPAGLIIDGAVIPRPMKETFTSGQFNRVPFISGSNRDEWRWSIAMNELASGHPLTAADYPAAVASFYGSTNASKVLAQYPLSNYSSPSEALGAAETDSFLACSGRKLSQWISDYSPVYAYEFVDRTAPSYMPPVSFPLGAAHTFEIQYLFPLYHGALGTPHPLNAAQENLSDAMVYFWTELGWSERPNHQWPEWFWPRYDANVDDYESLQLPLPVMTDGTFGKEHNCDFWDTAGTY